MSIRKATKKKLEFQLDQKLKKFDEKQKKFDEKQKKQKNCHKRHLRRAFAMVEEFSQKSARKDSEALHRIGLLVMEKHPSVALAIFKEAAEKKNAISAQYAGAFLRKDSFDGKIKKDYTESLKYFLMSKKLGHDHIGDEIRELQSCVLRDSVELASQFSNNVGLKRRKSLLEQHKNLVKQSMEIGTVLENLGFAPLDIKTMPELKVA